MVKFKQTLCPKCNSRRYETTDYSTITGYYRKECRDCKYVERSAEFA